MSPNPLEQHRNRQNVPGRGLRRFVFILILLGLAAIIVCLLVIAQLWHNSQASGQNPTPTSIATVTPHSSPTSSPTPATTSTPNGNLTQRIDTYIDHMTPTQQIGQLLMLAVYTNGYTSALNRPIQQWDIANAIVFNNYNGGR